MQFIMDKYNDDDDDDNDDNDDDDERSVNAHTSL